MFNRATSIGRAMAASAIAVAAAGAATAPVMPRKIPQYMQRGFGVRSYDRALRDSKGEIFRKGLHVTAKTHRGIPCRVTPGENPDARIERLQMLKDRRLRREERRAHG
jgi:hypothetical protein